MQHALPKGPLPVEAAALLAQQHPATLQPCNPPPRTATHSAKRAAACQGSGSSSRTMHCKTATLQRSATLYNTLQHTLQKWPMWW